MTFDTLFRPLSFHPTNIEHTKLCGLAYKQRIYKTTCPYSCTRSKTCTKLGAFIWPINCNTIPQKVTVIPYMAQPGYTLNSQVLAIFFHFATTPTLPHYPKFTVRYRLQYGRSSCSLHFMTHTFFRLFSPQLHLFLNHMAGPIPCTHHPWPHWQSFSSLTPTLPELFPWCRLCRSSKDNVPA